MAFRRKLGNLAQLLLQSHMKNREEERQSELIRQRQMELAEQNFTNTVLGRMVNDPSMARRLRDSGMQKVAGFDTNLFVPSAEEAMGSVAKEIQAAPDKFDPLSIINKYNAHPGALTGPEARPAIEQLIAQRNSAFERGRMTTPPELMTEIRDDGSTVQRAINPNMMPEEGIRTGLSAGQEGANSLNKWMENEGSELRNLAELRNTVQTRQVTDPLDVKKAANIASASERAKLAAEGAFYSSKEGQALLATKAQAAMNQARSQAEMTAIVKSTEASGKFLPNIIALEASWKKAQPEIKKLVEGGIISNEDLDILQAKGLESLPTTVQQMMSPQVRQYFEMRGAYLPIFARVLSEVGNLNEQEQMRAVGLAPNALDALDPTGHGDRKIRRMKTMMVNMPDIQRELFRLQSAPPEARLAAIERIIGPAEEDVATPAEAPNSALEAARARHQRTVRGGR